MWFDRNVALLNGFDDRTDGAPDSVLVTDVLDQARAEQDARNMGGLG